MPWLRVGDTAATNPIVSEVREHPGADDRSKVEVFGFVCLCAVTAAQHLTDYVVSRATAADIVGSMERADVLLEQAVFAGYMEPVIEEVRGTQRQRWRIVEDPEFFHMRTEEEIEWERRRKRDNSNPALTVPVKLRDGDACRYCGQVVKWTARKGRLRGTYDHRKQGQGAESPEDLVVCCDRCNNGRNGNPNREQDFPLLPPPDRPYYSLYTVKQLQENDWAKAHNVPIPPLPKTNVQPGTVPAGHQAPAPGTKAAGEASTAPEAGSGSTSATEAPTEHAAPDTTSGARPDGRDTEHERPGKSDTDMAHRGSADLGRTQQIPTDRHPSVSDGPGTGRDGTGWDGTGLGGSPDHPPTDRSSGTGHPHDHKKAPRRRPRGKRGGRKNR